MGLIDRILSLLGMGGDSAHSGDRRSRDGDATGRSVGDASATEVSASSPQAASNAGTPDPFAERFQMHGSHWDTVVPEADRERSIQTATMGAIQNGEPTAGQPLDGEEVTGYTDLEGPVGTRTVSVGGQVYTSYPFAEGIQADASVEEFHEWTNGIEAWASLAVGPASVTAFATDYFSYHDGAPEAPASVAVTGFCYQLRPADDDSAFEDALDAPALDDDFVGLFPWDRGGPDDYVLRTTVEEVTRIDADAFDGSVLRVPLFRRDDAPDPVLPLVVADHVAGNFDPAAGDDITAVLWLQAEIDA